MRSDFSKVSMRAELVHIGFGSVVAVNRVMAIVAPDSAPVRRMVQQARSEGKVIDLTYGRKTKSVVVMDNGYLVLAAIHPETIVGRLSQQRGDRGVSSGER